jgi:hypothetical protein
VVKKVMLDAFYGAFSPACFALLGLWLVVVQMRLPQWQASAARRRGSYGVALHFALPGIMTVLALIDPQNPAFWRVSFGVVALGGVVVMATVHGLPPKRDRAEDGQPGWPEAGGRAASGQRGIAAPAGLSLLAYAAALVLYALIGALAIVGGPAALRTEAVLLTILIFLGFNAAWLLLLDEGPVPRASHPYLPRQQGAGAGPEAGEPGAGRAGHPDEAQHPG